MCVITDATQGADQVGQGRRGPGEELQIDRRIDSSFSQSPERSKGPENHAPEATSRDSDDVWRRYQLEDVQNATVLGEHQKIDVSSADALDRRLNGMLCEHC